MEMDNNFIRFDNYFFNFNLNEPMMVYKYKHSYRVMKECEEISKYLHLDEEDTYISGVIGLLHDIGRFYQWENFKTFKDNKYFYHADYGVKILFEDNLIKEYDVDREEYD